ncbi:MAG TPA: helix-turn-helix transcriptional regulator [Chryseolinea sp.]|nr:helix-turn-helix transcriptional regulator [Chryseolinea sp.]
MPRKKKGLNRDDLGGAVGTSGAMIGKYERDEMTPSVEMAKKIADGLDVSLDYLIGSSSVLVKDKKMAYRLELLDKISDEDRITVLKVMDALLKDAQIATLDKKLR